MTAIWFVAFYHLLLGIAILLLPDIPRPFGQIEPFLARLSVEQVGWMFVAVSAWSVMGLVAGTIWYVANPYLRLARRVFFLLPQQFVITWGAWATLWTVINSHDSLGDPANSRSILVLCFLVPATALHVVGATVWYLSPPRWTSPLCRPCPFFNLAKRIGHGQNNDRE